MSFIFISTFYGGVGVGFMNIHEENAAWLAGKRGGQGKQWLIIT